VTPTDRLPKLDSVAMTMTLGDRMERLSEQDYLLLQQLIAFREQKLTTDSLKDMLALETATPDRVIEAAMTRLIRKTNALHPRYPLVRRVSCDTWLYTDVPPKIKSRAAPLS